MTELTLSDSFLYAMFGLNEEILFGVRDISENKVVPSNCEWNFFHLQVNEIVLIKKNYSKQLLNKEDRIRIYVYRHNTIHWEILIRGINLYTDV